MCIKRTGGLSSCGQGQTLRISEMRNETEMLRDVCEGAAYL